MTNNRVDIGIASYKSADKLQRTIASIQQWTRGDFRLFVIHNPSEGDGDTRAVIETAVASDSRITPVWMPINVGYAGAVSELMRRCISEPGWNHLIYCDNDIVIQTDGWDEILCSYLDRYPEIGIVYPNGGAYPMQREHYTEVMWGVGFCFATTRKVVTEVGLFDETLGHQEEADYALRVRMAGYVCAAVPQVSVHHDATATNDPEARERINAGIVRWVDKWNKYYNGKKFGYHSPNVTRWEDWPPNALYLEEYWKLRLPHLNDNPEEIELDGKQYDLIKVPRLRNFYRGRII